jgi:hypothetical protein
MKNETVYEQIGVAMTCRSYEEYVRMFALRRTALRKGPVLDVAAGASSFAAEARRRGADVYSADPLYTLAPDEIAERGRREIAEAAEKLSRLAGKYDWSFYGSPERHRAMRERALLAFVDNYAACRDRYVPATLPSLPFADRSFSLVLCSHFLFLYAEQFDYEFHAAALDELYRVCEPGGEVRVYPLVSLRFEPYPELDRLIDRMAGRGARCATVPTRLEFMPGSTHLLCIRKPEA